MAEAYDLIVIGGGPGGYNCAIRAAQLGLKVACIEKHKTLGGTCLNVGCIPSKALLHASELYEEAQNGMAKMGVKPQRVTLDLPAMMKHKNESVGTLTKGIEFLFKKNKVTHVKGMGEITGPGKVDVKTSGGGTESLEGKNIVIATGSDPMGLPGIEIDETDIVSSTGALSLGRVPKTMIVVGGGYIGLEMGSVWRRLGSKVMVIEFLDHIVPGMDGEVAKQFQRVLKKQGMEFKLGSKVTGVKKLDNGLEVSVEPAKGGDEEMIKCEVVLVSIGRKPHTDGLGLEKAGVRTDNRGFIPTENYQTNVEGILCHRGCHPWAYARPQG